MLKDERQRWIVEKLNTDKKVSMVALSQELGVSYDSIRRDIIELEERGYLTKVHGGAIANSYLPMKDRQALGIPSSEITILAQKALNLIRPDQIILMDGGTTNRYIAEQFPENLRTTVVTNSPPLAISLSSHTSVEVILLGGSFHKSYQITLGCEAATQLRHFRADLYFMGVVGVHPTKGLTIRHYEESLLKRQMMDVAQKTVVCVTPEKYLNVEAYQICDMQEVDILLTSNQAMLEDMTGWQLTTCTHF